MQKVGGIGITGCNVHVISVRQAITPDAMLGRINSIYRLITYGVILVGALIAGLFGTWLGLRPTLFISTSVLALDFLWMLFSPIPRLQQAPTEIAQLSV